MGIYEQLSTLQGDWPRQRELILNYPYAQQEPRPKQGWGDVEPPPPDSFRDVHRAACAGIITMDQYYEVVGVRYEQARATSGPSSGPMAAELEE